MSQKLTKKQRKYYSKLIIEKLLAMGVKDELALVPTGKKRNVLKLNEKGEISFKDGKPEFEQVDVPVAQNILRRTVRNLRNLDFDAIEAFLSMEVPKTNG